MTWGSQNNLAEDSSHPEHYAMSLGTVIDVSKDHGASIFSV
jgi:hypothetical protein